MSFRSVRPRIGLCVLALSSIAVWPVPAQSQEFRGFWADVFHEGYKSPAEVDALVSRALAGGYNAVLPEVMAYQDNAYASHGAYWNSDIVPRSSVVTPSFDPLGYLVTKAHAAGLQVHPWLVAFRVSTAWPPAGNSLLAAHPEYLMVPQGSTGRIAPVGSDYQLDPGSPDVQEYLVSIVTELVNNYEVDGIHWDYIRYTQSDAGYPADTSYANSSLERFRRITSYTGTPTATGDPPWDDFRRRTITEIIRRVRAELGSMTAHPRQPLRHSAALITWGNAPSTFTGSSAWVRFQNWEEWMRLGFLDTGIPMTYYDYGTYPTYYRNWVDKEMQWRYQRQMVVGPGIYLNTFDNSLTEMQYARSKGADGLSTYSYWSTKKSSSNDWSWYSYVAANFFTSPASVPAMPWRDSAAATEGTLWGQVLDPSSGVPIDDAAVQVGGLGAVRTDANGYYVVTMIPAIASGTSYTVTATSAVYTATHSDVVVVAGEVRRDDFTGYGPPPPTITQQPQPQEVCTGAAATFSVTATSDGTLTYQWQKDGLDLADGGHCSGATTGSLSVSPADLSDAGEYRCVVTGSGGSTTSSGAALTVTATVAITGQPTPQNACPGSSATFSVAASAASSYQWRKDGVDLAEGGQYSGVSSPTLIITGVDASDAGAYDCVVNGQCGSSAVSNDAALTLKPQTVISQQPISQTVDTGATVQFTVAAAGEGTLAYHWQKDGGDLADGGHYSGVTTSMLTISSADANDAAAYRCLVSAECGSALSNDATLTVNPGPGVMDVSPADGLVSSGTIGGPFAPSSIAYTVSNTGGQSTHWAVSATQPWVSLDKTGGTLAAGAGDTVVVLINANADSLAVGSYTDTVTFTNLTNGNGDTTRAVSLTVSGSPGVMDVFPIDDLNSIGSRGGPFTPPSITYTITNTGGERIDWAAAADADWLTLSRSGGMLDPGASELLVVSINSVADKLKQGAYNARVTLTNSANGMGDTSRGVRLLVKRK